MVAINRNRRIKEPVCIRQPMGFGVNRVDLGGNIRFLEPPQVFGSINP
jgi:hypothetical protein